MWTLSHPRIGVGASGEQALEDTGAELSPLVAEYTAMRETVFAIADDIGIGSEVRTIYYDVATGARGGQAFGAILSSGINPEAIALNVAAGGGASAGAAVGMSLGTVVGAAVAIVSLLASDDDDEEQAKKHRAEFLQWRLDRMRKRATIDDLIGEQVEQAHVIRTFFIPLHPVRAEDLSRAADRADKIAELYRRIKKDLPPLQVEIFVSVTNLVRFAQAETEVASVLSGALGGYGSKLGLAQVAKDIDALRKKESVHLEDVLGKAAAQRSESKGSWLFLPALLALSALAVYGAYSPAGALSLYRSGSRYAATGYRIAVSQSKRALGSARSLVT